MSILFRTTALLLVAGALASARAATFEGLGGLPGFGLYTIASDLSGDGQVVVGQTETDDPQGAFRWEDGVLFDLATAGWVNAQAASYDGGVVAGRHWRWDHGVVTQVLGWDGLPVYQIVDVSADGSVMVGQHYVLTTMHAFRTDGGVVVPLELPAGTPSSLASWRPYVSADGSVIAGTASICPISGCAFGAFRWENGVSEWLPALQPGDSTEVSGISADGSVIIGTSGEKGVYWQDGVLVELAELPGLGAGRPHGVSADGSIITGATGTQHPTLWHRGEAHQIFNLLASQVDLTGWVLQANAGYQPRFFVSDDGLTVAGTGVHGGNTEAWIAHWDRCRNGLDDDGDGLADFPNDPGCANGVDDSEQSASLACDDGLDNDGDGLVDFPNDPACQTLGSPIENPKCDDDLDNDGDGKIDWDGGAAAGTPDPQCTLAPWKDRERANNCGLGAELAIALAIFAIGRRRVLR